jgi:copper chaperone
MSSHGDSGLSFIWLFKEQDMIKFQVADMTCGHCAATVTKAVKALDAEAGVKIDLAAHRVEVESARTADEVKAVIAAAGYTPLPAA